MGALCPIELSDHVGLLVRNKSSILVDKSLSVWVVEVNRAGGSWVL